MTANNTDLRMKRILRSFMTAQENDANCEECYEHLDQFVEMVDAGTDAATILPRIEAHINICSDCGEEYQALLSVLRSQVDPDTIT